METTSLAALWWAVILSGAYHGLNPGMGWPLAVSAALMERKAKAMPKALLLLTTGHLLAMIAILLPFSLKKFVFPTLIGLLGVFSIHLLIQTIGGESSNCGCFGELIPMTPLQALIKNLITIGLLILPLTILREGLVEKKKFSMLVYLNLTVWILMFVFLPFGTSNDDLVISVDSGYSGYFEDINKDEKIICFFSPTCEHCQETGKILSEFRSKEPETFPEIRILFMDEA